MKVREIMSRDVEVCTPETNLAAAGELMWNRDCGAIPVVAHNALTGMLTDRDVCIALVTRNLPAGAVQVKDVVTHEPHACQSEDDVATALEIMRTHQVRRLPVLNMAGRLEGVLSLNDIILHAVRRDRSVNYELVMDTLKAICEHSPRKSALPEQGAAAVLTAMGS